MAASFKGKAAAASRSGVDHLVPDEVHALVARIEAEQGGLHVLVDVGFPTGWSGPGLHPGRGINP